MSVDEKKDLPDRIGAMLVDGGLVTQDDINRATVRRAETGEGLTKALLVLGSLDSRRLVKYLATQTEFAKIDISQFDIDPEVIALVPAEFAQAHQVVPVDRFRNVLTVAMLCPVDDGVRRSLEDSVGLEVRPVLCSEEDVRASIRRYYGGGVETDSSAEGIEAPLRLSTAIATLRNIDSLPALPGTVQEVQEMVQGSEASSADVAEVVARDPAIAAKTLRLANSASYGLANQVDDIQLAVTLLGLRETYHVVLTSAIVNMFDKSKTFDYMTYWMESMVSASIAQSLAKSFEHLRVSGAFTAGLLHDIGRLALSEIAPKQFARLDPSLLGLELVAAEEKLLGLAHTESGFHLGVHWGLPTEIVETIRFHHSPALASDSCRTLVSLVSVAEVVSRAHRPDSASRELNLEECEESLEFLDLTERDVMDAIKNGKSAIDNEPLWSPN
jgi:HD-like signal output (HDOD) protein